MDLERAINDNASVSISEGAACANYWKTTSTRISIEAAADHQLRFEEN